MVANVPSRAKPLITTAVLDQGERPVCAAIAATTIHEAARDSSGALSLEALWQHAVAKGAADGAGTTLPAMANALADTGQPSETVWPFDSLDHSPQTVPAIAGTPPWYIAALSTHSLSALEIVDQLLSGTPVLAAMNIYKSFYDAGETGIIAHPAPTDKSEGRHAVVCVAYIFAGPDRDTLHLLIRNSWGTEWGSDGHAWISAETFDQVCDETATVVAA